VRFVEKSPQARTNLLCAVFCAAMHNSRSSRTVRANCDRSALCWREEVHVPSTEQSVFPVSPRQFLCSLTTYSRWLSSLANPFGSTMCTPSSYGTVKPLSWQGALRVSARQVIHLHPEFIDCSGWEDICRLRCRRPPPRDISLYPYTDTGTPNCA